MHSPFERSFSGLFKVKRLTEFAASYSVYWILLIYTSALLKPYTLNMGVIERRERRSENSIELMSRHVLCEPQRDFDVHQKNEWVIGRVHTT